MEQNIPVVTKKVDPWMVTTVIFAVLFLLSTSLLVYFMSYTRTKLTVSPAIPTPTITLTQAPVAQTPTYPDKELLGENNNYMIYMVNKVPNSTPETVGNLLVESKSTKAMTLLTGTFEIFGAVIVIDDNNNNYILLSTGTSPVRAMIPISLIEKKAVAKQFCSLGTPVFYQDRVYYGNCDRFNNRPWEGGEASSLLVMDLKTGNNKTLFKSDLLHQYGPSKITGNTLYYLETSVKNEADWQNPDKQLTVTKTMNISSF